MSAMETHRSGSSDRKRARKRLHGAIRRSRLLSPAGLSERLFAHLFTGLVYAQIWEDPEVDMAALAIRPGDRVVTIASGGCNALSYLLADPAAVEAVDLNAAHVAFNRLKLAALVRLPDHGSFYRFFGRADAPENLAAYERFLRPHLDADTRRYWEKRKLSGRRRISIFSRSLYRHGLLGHFIGMGHRVARLYGIDPRGLLAATSMEEQRRFFDQSISPLFEKPRSAGRCAASPRCSGWASRRSNTTRWPAAPTWLRC